VIAGSRTSNRGSAHTRHHARDAPVVRSTPLE